jgi:hypothetical protein
MRGKVKVMKIWILVAAAAGSSGTAQAADVAFAVNGVKLAVPIPAGYCVPEGRDKLVADTLAKGDTENITLATLLRCDMTGRAAGPGNDYILIKSPNLALGTSIARADFLRALGAEFGKAEWQNGTSATQATENAAKGLSDALNTSVEIKGDIAPRGTDGDCAYLGGTLNVNGAGVTYPIILGGCITTAGDKVVAVYTYDDPGKGGGVTGKMRTARNIAMKIRTVR